MNETQKDRLAGCIPNITYNEETVFPKELEKEFPAQQILEKGKSPGLGVEALHEQGITGKGVGIAIIDQVLYTGHPEYASNLALYEEMHVVPNQSGSMHGAAPVSYTHQMCIRDRCGTLYSYDISIQQKEQCFRVEGQGLL